MTERSKYPKRPVRVECPLETCRLVFAVEDFEDSLPSHNATDGRWCPYEGLGHPIDILA